MPDPFFAGPGLDRADLLRAQPEKLAELLAYPDARALRWYEGAPALDSQGRLIWDEARGDEALFLGLDGDAPRFSAIPEGGAEALGVISALFPRLAELREEDAPTFACALSLANWHARHPFCSVCGEESRIDRGGWSRHCDTCGGDHYPRSDPVVIMLAEHEDRLLMGRQPHYPPGRFSALAGFVEPGETIEAAVAREFHEEAGIEVSNIRYLASQPWPFPNTLMIGAIADARGDQLTIDYTELEDCRWFTRGEVEAALAGDENAPFAPPPKAAIARTLLDAWAKRLM